MINDRISKETNKLNREIMELPFDLNAFRLAYDNNPQVFCIVHVLKENEEYKDIVFIYANKSYEKMSGISLDTLIGHSYTEIIGNPSDHWNKIYGDIAYIGGENSLIVPGPEIDAYLSVQCFQVAPGYCGSNVLDVTKEIKDAQKAKEESKKNWERIGSERALYQSILDTTADMITVIDAETYEIIYANAMAKQVTSNITGGYVGSMCFHSIRHSDGPCEDCILFGKDKKQEEIRELKYGSRVYRMTYKIMKWNERRVLLEYSEDITESKEKETEFQQHMDFIVNLDTEDLIAKGRHNLTKNRPIEIVGKKTGAVIGTNESDYDSLVDEMVATAITEDKKRELATVLNRKNLLQEFAKGNKEFTINYRRYLGENKLTWVTMKGSLYQEPKTHDIIAFYYSYDNTNQLQESLIAKRLSALEYVLVGLIDVENHQITCLYGQTVDAEKIGENGWNYDSLIMTQCDTSDIVGDNEALIEALSFSKVHEKLKEKTEYTVDFSRKNPTGTTRRYSFSFCYLDEYKDTVLCFCSDITEGYEQEQKQLNDINDALEQARISSKAKTDFLSRMSHDMRTPMNGILGLVSLLMDEKMPENVKDGLQQIQLSGKYLLNLINDTLDVNKIESNRLELHNKVTDAYKLIENIVTNSKMLAAEKGVSFQYVIVNQSDITQTILYMDESRTEQLFMNLVSNAVKFTPEGGKVTFSIERLETTEDSILDRYQVKDNGIGMSKEFLQHLYEPFSQEGRLNTNRESGTGLGMAIVWQIAKLMDADLQVESELNVGTTFTFTVRLKKYKGEVQESGTKQLKEEDLVGRHVLLCEDHPLNRQIAEKLLEKKGMIVDTAEDGEEGLLLYRNSAENYYDVVLMDIRMPKMNGYEATKQIRNSRRVDAKTIPVIAMTANAFDDDVKECLESGMNAHISKPIEVDKMFQTIIEYL